MTEYVIAYGFSVNSDYLPMVINNGIINLPGGKLEKGEDPVFAGLRELKKETGLEEVQEYDPSVYYPSEYMGKILGNLAIIHCVKVPIVYDASCSVEWHLYPSVLGNPRLMPNLRIVIPLMRNNVKNWFMEDDGRHTVELHLDGERFTVSVKRIGNEI
jgi:8-oxo-dGTP pyrophosphatase MutT (NUDIX family)